MIAIGNQFGGPELKGSVIQLALSRAAQIAIRARRPKFNDGSAAWINPIFIVPGSMWNVEFEGCQIGHFSKKDKGLVIQISVPKAVAQGSMVRHFIVENLQKSIRIADKYFSSKKISFSVREAEEIIAAIEDGLTV